MTLRFHPAAQRDLNEALEYYAERSPRTADRLWEALHVRLAEIAANPERYGFIHRARGLRQVRLRRFPYLIIYYQTQDSVRVTCVKHEKRHPQRGMRRQ